MNTMLKAGGVMMVVILVGSTGLAQYRGDYRGNHYNDSRGCGSRGGYSSHYEAGRYNGGRHCGYYRNSHGELAFGLLGLGMAAAIVSTMDRPTVYVQQPPTVVYQAPQVVYVQTPQPMTMTINVQNSNGSFTPVLLRQSGAQWVGPRGEYYDGLPSIGQLRPAYGF